MLQKVITGEGRGTQGSEGAAHVHAGLSPITLKMSYNKGNQLISMANGQD